MNLIFTKVCHLVERTNIDMRRINVKTINTNRYSVLYQYLIGHS